MSSCVVPANLNTGQQHMFSALVQFYHFKTFILFTCHVLKVSTKFLAVLQTIKLSRSGSQMKMTPLSRIVMILKSYHAPLSSRKWNTNLQLKSKKNIEQVDPLIEFEGAVRFSTPLCSQISTSKCWETQQECVWASRSNSTKSQSLCSVLSAWTDMTEAKTAPGKE